MRKTFATIAALLTFSSALAFSDVGQNSSHENAIEYLAQYQVVSGFSDGQFKPQQRITRAELAKIVVGARGENPSPREFNACFSDVSGEWYARFVCYAKDADWLNGYSDGKFRPGAEINRAEASKIILNALGIAFDDARPFNDVEADTWFAPFANTIRSRNLFEDETFSAGAKITRGEVVEIIYRALLVKNSGASQFTASLGDSFDTAISPKNIIDSTLDFMNSENGNVRITKWRISNGVWMLKPTLEFNGGIFSFNSPDEYVAALETIQEHFEVIQSNTFAESLSQYIAEFGGALVKSPSLISTTIAPASESSSVGVAANFTGVNLSNESEVAARGGPVAQVSNTKIYIGYEILVPLNYNPVIVSFTNGEQNWARRDYETSSDESIGYGILWAGSDKLFAVFTSRGVEENINLDFRRFAKYGWLSDYGEGSGRQVAVIAKINPTDGGVVLATYLSTRQSDGQTNSLTVTDLEMNGTNLVVSAEAWEAPRRVTTQPMDKKESADNSPFDYEIEFTPNLQTAVRAEAPGFGK